jgi:hypothetical protein
MKGPQAVVANVGAALIAVVAVAVLLGPRVFHAASATPSPKPSSISLPPGVCALSLNQLPASQATRIEAKLVTFETAVTDDPYFRGTKGTSATGARLSYPSPTSAFYWVVAAEGEFHLNAPVPPGGALPEFNALVFHVRTDSCQIDQTTSIIAWPSWFDKLPSVADLKLK